MKIFGIGLNKTGTTTLGRCFEILGFSHLAGSSTLLESAIAKKDLSKVYGEIEKYDSFEDLPFCLIYKDLDKRFPNSKFILTIRKNSKIWLNSFRKHCDRGAPAGCPRNRLLAYGYESTRGHEKEFIKIYEQHIKDVKTYFANKPNKLLVCCWEEDDGWKPLCDFLDRPIPTMALPWRNKGDRTIGWLFHRLRSKLKQMRKKA